MLTPDAALDRLALLLRRGKRTILGLAGPPGAGKSTFAGWLTIHAAVAVSVVPMDGFHLTNAELDRLGGRSRKGAPDTFDTDGYVDMLRHLRFGTEHTVFAPGFDRVVDESTAGSIAVTPWTRLVITEGNYLLTTQGGWESVADLLDEVWWICCPAEKRRERLIRRHRVFGLSTDGAEEFVNRSDEANARLVASDFVRADFLIEPGPTAARQHHLPGES